jgi:hypothetical protein
MRPRWTNRVPIFCAAALLVGCDRAGERAVPTASLPGGGLQAELIGDTDVPDWLERALQIGSPLATDPAVTPWQGEEDNDPPQVVPFQFDPFRTRLVRAHWLMGTGCPTGATTFIDDPLTPEFDPVATPFTDSACPTGDPDKSNEGLLLVKTGPTANFASAGAFVTGEKGIELTELGYDIRKGLSPVNLAGSHCGAGAPRFNVVTRDGVNHFVGCNSPPAGVTGTSTGWLRLRWNAALLAAAFPPILPGNVVESITIIFDEAQDVPGGPDSFGLAVIDNISINGKLVGRGPGN